MSIRLMTWVFDSSPYEGKALLVHLILADHANDDGECFPSQATIARKARCTVEYVRRCTIQMQHDGLLTLSAPSTRQGRSNTYRLLCPSPTQLGSLTPGTPQPGTFTSPTTPPSNHQEPSELPTAAAVPAASAVEETPNQRMNRLAKAYTDLVPMSRFPAVAGIVRKAMNAGHDDGSITDALTRLADDGRSLTVETLRIELEGLPANRQAAASGARMFADAAASLDDRRAVGA